MIRLGLRLAVAGGREAVVRLTIIAAAVAIGVGLLLTTISGVHAVNSQNARYAWLNTGLVKNPANAGAPAADPALWRPRRDYFHGTMLGRIDVAVTGPDSPVPPGLPRLPAPGEFYVSPELHDLLRTTPADQLGDRFPGREAGVIGTAGLPAPNSLLVVVGNTPAQLAGQPNVHQVNRIETRDPSDCQGCQVGTPAAGIDLILSVVTAALIFPLLMFIGTATRLAAARREERFAAMRLVGATPRQIAVLSAVESTLAALGGAIVGFGLFYAFRHGLAAIPFTGEPFFPGDLSITLLDAVLVLVGVPFGAAVAARIALRRVQISPLGVTRRVTPKPPRAWRLLPLAVGLGELAYFVGRRPETTDGQVRAYLSGILLVMVGLVVAGPWLTMVGSRALAGRAGRPAALIAGRRLADNPQAGFRAVSGLMLALFVTAVATGVITTLTSNRGVPAGAAGASDAVTQMFWPQDQIKGRPAPGPEQIPADLRRVPGVLDVLVVRANPAFRVGVLNGAEPGVIACADLAKHPSFTGCAPGAQVADVFPALFKPANDGDTSSTTWDAAPIALDRLESLPMLAVVVPTDGSAAAIERARTLMETALPSAEMPGTEGEFRAAQAKQLIQWQQLANVVILTTLPIAGCSLAVSVAGGLSERKKPFSMLRLTGVRLEMLRRVIALESAVPLLAVAALATGMGFVTAQLFLRAQLGYNVRPPGAGYYVLVIGGLVASLGIIASTLPLLRRITGPETARNE
jgi:hypothetical protein